MDSKPTSRVDLAILLREENLSDLLLAAVTPADTNLRDITLPLIDLVDEIAISGGGNVYPSRAKLTEWQDY